MRRRLGATLLGALLAAIPAPARAEEDPPCRVEVSLEPERAWVGQQVLFRARMLRRESVREVRWLRALSFPSLRAEWLPGRMPDPRIEDVGDAYVVSEDRRALFPVRPGTIEIPPGLVGCRLAADGEHEVTVPGVTLLATALPESGRPPDFAGVVGPVEVNAYLSRQELGLGEALRLIVVVAGEANVWDAAPPLDPALPHVDVYPHELELVLDPGDRLRARRRFVWDLVPRRAGRLELPAPRVPWFDPATGRYAVANGPRLTADVREPAAAPTAAPPAAPAARADDGAQRGPRSFVLLAAVALGALGLAVAARLHGRSAPLRAAAPALADAERALAAGDRGAAARALAAALRAGLGLRLPGAGALAAEEVAARARGRTALADAAALLADLDHARFATTPPSEPLPSLERVRTVLRAIGR